MDYFLHKKLGQKIIGLAEESFFLDSNFLSKKQKIKKENFQHEKSSIILAWIYFNLGLKKSPSRYPFCFVSRIILNFLKTHTKYVTTLEQKKIKILFLFFYSD